MLLELYMRFGPAPAMLCSGPAGHVFVAGDARALDAAVLAGLNPKYGRLHRRMHSHLPPPELPALPPGRESSA